MAEGLASAQLIDELAANAWPAPVWQVLDGWILRFGYGFTRRANSVYANGKGALSPEIKIETAERFYWQWGVPSRFQVSPASLPVDLDERLAVRGYHVEGRTLIMTAPIPALLEGTSSAKRKIEIEGQPGPRWLETWSEVEGIPSRRELAGTFLARIGWPAAYASLELGGRPVAVGRGVLERGRLGIFGMGTLPEARRQGAATAVIHGLAAWAGERCAEQAYLLVEEDNQPAVAAYERAGFLPQYSYHYRCGVQS